MWRVLACLSYGYRCGAFCRAEPPRRHGPVHSVPKVCARVPDRGPAVHSRSALSNVTAAACTRGLRITAWDVLDMLASGMTEEDVLQDYPYLEKADFAAMYAYASQAGRERMPLVDKYNSMQVHRDLARRPKPDRNTVDRNTDMLRGE